MNHQRNHATIQPYAWSGPYANWRLDAPHDAGLCAEVRMNWMPPGERLILRCCEIVGYPQGYLYDDHIPPADLEGRGKHYQHTAFQWDVSEAPGKLSARCEIHGLEGFSVELVAANDGIEINLSVTNHGIMPLGPIDWAFCAISLECPCLRDPQQERTMIFDGSRLRSFQEISGSSKIRIYPVIGSAGFIPQDHGHLPVSSTTTPYSLIVVAGHSGRFAAALGFEQSYACFGCTGNMCFHADPHFGVIPPYGRKSLRGKLYLIEGTPEDALGYYRRDFLSGHLLNTPSPAALLT